MGPSVLKITFLIFSTFLNVIVPSEGMPLLKQDSITLADWTNYNTFEPEGPGTYSFGYDIEDPEKDNIQFRDEQRFPNGTVKGSYGYLRPDGMVQIVHYTADKEGYRAKFESYPRGQLKPIKLSEESTLSPALTAALQSKNVYKRQHVHEQHLRPVDKETSRYVAPSYTNRKDAYKREAADFSNYEYIKGPHIQEIDPYRVFIKTNQLKSL